MFQQTGSKCADLSASNSNSGTVIFRLSVNFYTKLTVRQTGDENANGQSVNSGSLKPYLDYSNSLDLSRKQWTLLKLN